MKTKPLFLIVTMVLLTTAAIAQNSPGCRQAWMAPDTPVFCPWQAEPSLPEARTYHAVAAYSNQIYVLGGFRFEASTSQVIYFDSVLRSTIQSDGRLIPWTTEPSFKNARSGAAALTVGNCLFIAGGSSSTPTSLTYFDDIQYAHLNSGGHLSPWTTSPNHLRTPRSNLSLVSITTDQGTFLSAVAGVTQTGADTIHLDTIEIAKVATDCSVGEWKVASYHLKGGRSTPQALVIRNNTVVIGGWGDLDLIDVYNDVETSTWRPDGSPSPWKVSTGRLTSGIYGHATALVETETKAPALLLSVGGQPGTGAYANWIDYAYVMPDLSLPDAISRWRMAPSGQLPAGRAGLGLARSQARLYVIGGSGANGTYFADVLSTQFDPGRP